MRLHRDEGNGLPKVVDHRERRRHIAEALWRVTVTYGLEGVSLRHVAAEAQVSMGMVQHYFTTKDDMLLFSLGAMNERITERVAHRVGSVAAPATPKSLVRAVLIELLPLDEERRVEAHVGLAFLARAAIHPSLAAALSASFDELHRFVEDQVCRAQAAGVAPADLEPHVETVELLALVDGLTAHVLAGWRSADTALQLLDRRLDRTFLPLAGGRAGR